jgi:hypothetical protein
MPFGKAGAAAGGGGVLSDEDGVPPHRSLLAVIGRMRGSQSAVYEVAGVIENGLHALRFEIVPFVGAEPEAAAEG